MCFYLKQFRDIMYIRYCFIIKIFYQMRRILSRLDGACRFDFNLKFLKAYDILSPFALQPQYY